MKKTLKNVLWGLILVAVGVIFALKAFGVEIEVLFAGWWTLFIIVPCAIELITDKNKIASLVGLLFGVALLLAARDIIEYSMIWKLIFPAALVVIGIYIIYRTLVHKKELPVVTTENRSGRPGNHGPEYAATFSGERVNFDGQIFTGTSLNAVFGSVTCDLRNAVIENDVEIEATAVFGGIDILLPPGVRVNVKSTSFFGDVDNHVKNTADITAPTVHINSTCIFGGIDVK